MKQPLHIRRRFFIALFFIIIFIVFIPLILLYSIGYRLDLNNGIKFTSTGGLYVFYPDSGADITLNGKFTNSTSLFSKGIYISELTPKKMSVEVSKTGYIPWYKNVLIEEKRVTEAYPYLIPNVISTSSVNRFIDLGTNGTISNPLYSSVVNLFATSTATSSFTSKLSATSTLFATTTEIEKKDILISINDGDIEATWEGNMDSIPFYFCEVGRSICKPNLTITNDGLVNNVDFYPGRNDVIIYSTKKGIFSTELDRRLPVNTHTLLTGNFEFREDGGSIYIKEKTSTTLTTKTTIKNPKKNTTPTPYIYYQLMLSLPVATQNTADNESASSTSTSI